MTDASDYGVGGVAFEPPADCDREVEELRQGLNGRQIVGAYSRTSNDTETRWGVFEKETFAIIQACGHFPVSLDPGVRVVSSRTAKTEENI